MKISGQEVKSDRSLKASTQIYKTNSSKNGSPDILGWSSMYLDTHPSKVCVGNTAATVDVSHERNETAVNNISWCQQQWSVKI